MLYATILQVNSNFLAQWVPLIFITAVIYFLMIRPQQKKAKEQKAFMEDLKKGDLVATGSGIVGKITKMDGKTIQIETAGKTHIDIIASTVNKEMSEYLNSGKEA